MIASAEPIRVLSLVPGRMRLHLPGWTGDGQEQLETCLGRVRGVERVQANPLTGNVLACFDPHAATADTILSALTCWGSAFRRLGREEAAEAGTPTLPPGSRHLPGRTMQSRAVRCGVIGVLGHAVVDTLLYTLAFAEPFGLPLAGLAKLHLGLDAVVWTASLAPLLQKDSEAGQRDGLAAGTPGS
jgi:hypothetical protein